MTLVTDFIGIVNEARVATAVEGVEVEGADITTNLIVDVDGLLGFCILWRDFEMF